MSAQAIKKDADKEAFKFPQAENLKRKRSQDNKDPRLFPSQKQQRAPSPRSIIDHTIVENTADGITGTDIDLLDADGTTPPRRPSPRSRYNSAFVSKLLKFLERNPEADLASRISRYSTERLNQLKDASGKIVSAPIVEREPSIELPSIHEPSGAFSVISALAPQVQTLIGLNPLDTSNAFSDHLSLWHVLRRGKVLHQILSKWIVMISPTIVVKFAPGLDISEYQTMCHVWSHRENIPVPEPLGAISIGDCNYIFMSYIKGETLANLWGSLSIEMKSSARCQLGDILRCLRRMPLQSDKYLGSGDPPLCRDLRRHVRTSAKSIANEIEFKEFLISTSQELNPVYLDLITSTLSKSHQIVMTHSDLRPENILALYTPPNTIRITGLIDWELSGAYPEYWEYVKALAEVNWNLSDWFSYLPVDVIGVHGNAWRQECLIDKLIL